MFGIKEIINKLNKIDKCTSLHKLELDHVKGDFKKHTDNDTKFKDEVLKKVGVCSESNKVKTQGEEIIAISTRQKIYAGILLVILSGIIGSFFWIVRSSL